MSARRHRRKVMWIMLILRPVMVLAIAYVMFGSRYFSSLTSFLWISVFTLAIIAAFVPLHVFVDKKMGRRFQGNAYTVRRMMHDAVYQALVTVACLHVLMFTFHLLHFYDFVLDAPVYFGTLAVGICGALAAVCFNEGFYLFDDWKSSIVETERIQKEHWQSQVQGLRNQVSPHFLFNSINTLSGLITEDRVKANRFLDELSQVYRYLLHHEKGNLVPLDLEVDFMKSWFHVLETRYNSGLQTEVSTSEKASHYMIPPLLIHLISENILGKNVVRKSNPLLIRITADDNGILEITNNILVKSVRPADVPPEDLAQLTERLGFLASGQITVSISETHQTVRIPLQHGPH